VHPEVAEVVFIGETITLGKESVQLDAVLVEVLLIVLQLLVVGEAIPQSTDIERVKVIVPPAKTAWITSWSLSNHIVPGTRSRR